MEGRLFKLFKPLPKGFAGNILLVAGIFFQQQVEFLLPFKCAATSYANE